MSPSICNRTLIVVSGLLLFSSEKFVQAETEIFEWLDSLDIAVPVDAPFAKIDFGYWTDDDGNRLDRNQDFGFIVADSPSAFTVLGLDLKNGTHSTEQSTELGFANWVPASWEKADLAAFANSKVATDTRITLEDIGYTLGPAHEIATQRVLLSWICKRRGLAEVSDLLLEETTLDPTEKFAAIRGDIAKVHLWQTILRFNDPEIPLTALEADLRIGVRISKGTEFAERSEDTLRVLQSMIAEVEERPLLTVVEIASLPREKQIAEWIRHLCNQNGYQMFEPGGCSIFMTRDRSKDTAAHRLLEYGYDAVPQLIEILDDERLTRSIGQHRSFYFSHRVLRFRDCAQQIIRRVSGESFWGGPQSEPSAKEKALAWWEEFQEKGERTMLVEAVTAGDRGSSGKAPLLIERYPDVAFDAIIEGLEQPGKNASRSNLFRSLMEVPGNGDRKIETALRFLDNDKDLSVRVLAARWLWHDQEHRVEAFDSLLRDWRDGNIGMHQINEYLPDRGRELLLDTLLCSNSPLLLAKISADYESLKQETVVEILDLYWDKRNLSEFLLPPREAFAATRFDIRLWPDTREESVSAEAIQQLEILGQRFLEDHRKVPWSGGTDNVRYDQPPISEVAGHAMARWWPDRYKSNLGTEVEEDEQSNIRVIF
ncbi:MAG: hypothetical protein AAF236_07680 [Verrucomicrobiota bacterium]